MVSITRGVSISSSGGVLLPSESSADADDDNCILCSRNHADFDGFKPLRTGHVVFLQLMIAVGVEVAAVLLHFLWPSSLGKCEPFFIIVYAHAVFWLIVLIVHSFLRQKHHMLMIRGYVEFHKNIAVSSKITFYLVSATNTLMLVLVTVLCQNYDDLKKQCENPSFLRPYEYLLGIISLENIFFIPYCISYLVKVRRFNRKKDLPDFRKNEWQPQFVGESNHTSGEIGFWNTRDEYEKLVQTQADIIRCLRFRSDALCEKIIELEGSFGLS
ncbi:transmembrane protein 192 [Ischnura elegans]|uniref:transmembrane protein 192 n=1 Tax=Ischnura elegans TaxID=197161 RepID=UPI001ED8930D|nr:transmembrane protein 192 [Ischnura elegans]